MGDIYVYGVLVVFGGCLKSTLRLLEVKVLSGIGEDWLVARSVRIVRPCR